MSKLKNNIRKLLKIFLFTALVIIICIASFLGYLYIDKNTTLNLPSPSGKYAIGRMLYDWTDSNRIDSLSDKINEKRELAVWVWYPADVNSKKTPAPYLPIPWIKARDKSQGLGILIEHNFKSIVTNSYENTPIASAQSSYPVLIMEPGYGPAAADYTIIAENLASNGYIVVGINPTYTSNIIVFPDGRVVMRSLKGTIPDNAGAVTANKDANMIGSVWADDVTFAVNQLEAINNYKNNMFYSKLDLAHIGVFGHSLGGATAIEVCERDKRFKAGADLDGTPLSDEGIVTQPFMFITEDYAKGIDINFQAIQQVSNNVTIEASYIFSVKGTKHFNFSDLPFRQLKAVSPLFKVAGFTGSIDPIRAQEITNAFLIAFFDKYLKNIDSSLLVGPSETYPEVQYYGHLQN